MPAPKAQPKIDAVVLAAGRARRMGRPKHLIPIDGVPMILRVVRALTASRVRHVVCVLRASDADGARLLEGSDVRLAHPADLDHERAASVRAGMIALPGDAAGLLFCMADQPHLEARDFDALIAAYGPDAIAHARYAGERGTPVLFAARYRAELEALRGREGGRSVIARHPAHVRAVDLDPERGRDLDRPEDLD